MRLRLLRSVGCALVAVPCLACGSGSHVDVDVVPTLLAEETLRIGSVDDPETALSSIRALEIASDGRIVSLDSRERLIRIHAPDGSLLSRFGARGDGPGEFQSPLTMVLIHDELRVWDSRTQRVTRFDLDGQVLGVETLVPKPLNHPVLRGPMIRWTLPDGSGVGDYRRSEVPGSGWEDFIASPIVRVDGAGNVVDTLGVGSFEGWVLVLPLNEVGSVPAPVAYNPLFDVSEARSEAVFVDRAVRPDAPAFEVTKLSVEGDTLWSRQYPYDPVEIDPAYVDSFVVAMSEQIARAGMAAERSAEAALRETMVIPDHVPAVDQVWIGDDGSIWLALADRDPEETRWLVLREDGEVHGAVTLPHKLRLRWATLDEAWGVDLDELDVQYIVKLELQVDEAAEPS